MNAVTENIPVTLSFSLKVKECAHSFFRKPYVVKLFTYLPSFLFGKYKALALLIIRCREVFSNTAKHPLPRIKVYGGDKLETLRKWESNLKKPSGIHTELRFTREDSLTAALTVFSLVDLMEKIAMANFASRWQEGGVAKNPYGGSQEEALARHSNMAQKENFVEVHRQLLEIRKTEGYEANEDFQHHIPYFGTVVAADVTFITDKDSVEAPTQFNKFDTIWTAAVDNRKNSDERRYLEKHFGAEAENVRYEIMRDKIKAVFNTAIEENHQHLILGAFGCGCFENDDEKVALIFKDLYEKEYKDCFKSITFAIPSQRKLAIFQRVFDNKVIVK